VLRRLATRAAAPFVRPVLPYIEYHLVEHCNLTCSRCGHFSPLAPEGFSDPAVFERDLRQLARHFSTITMIRLMGGEPLLHPTPEAFVTVARQVFPRADLRIVTNGTLLKSMKAPFWEACRRDRVTLDMSVYPVVGAAVPDLEGLCATHGVALAARTVNTFWAALNPHGDSDPHRALAYCRSLFYCPFLSDGRLHVCSLPPTVKYYNEAFSRAIPADPGIDIFDPALDGRGILAALNTPVETCRFCALRYSEHPWEATRQSRPEDFDAEGTAPSPLPPGTSPLPLHRRASSRPPAGDILSGSGG